MANSLVVCSESTRKDHKALLSRISRPRESKETLDLYRDRVPIIEYDVKMAPGQNTDEEGKTKKLMLQLLGETGFASHDAKRKRSNGLPSDNVDMTETEDFPKCLSMPVKEAIARSGNAPAPTAGTDEENFKEDY